MTCIDAVRCVRAYSRRNVVAYYSSYQSLQKPEATILRALSPRLGAMRMLDIGVGGGRMTEHFAPRVKDYQGIDISADMVDACRRRFLGRLSPGRFQLHDMRALDEYPSHSFDLVLNSYNTIDHLAPPERTVFLAQARRIVSPGGYLCFSAHNIRSLATCPAIEWSWRRPHATLRALLHRRRYLRLNRRALDTHAQADYVIINNGTHDDFALELLYVRPEAQLEALRLAGFAHVTVYSLDTGGVIGEAIAGANDRWLYYLCS